ncbi:MAG TPA: glycosyltransferase, partial [Terriglobales bacterium]|nr:glycosyltransferase [Terriglobales bacterium]
FRPVYVGLRSIDGLRVPAQRRELLASGCLSRARCLGCKLLGPNERQVAQLRRLQPALVHAHFGPDASHAMLLARALSVPLVVTHHGYDITAEDHALSHSPLLRLYLKRRPRLYKAAALVLCVSQFVREKALRKGAPPHKTLAHYIGIDIARFTPDPSVARSDTVLFVGRLNEIKGCDYLLRAMRFVQQSRPECRLVIIGDGPLRAQLEQTVRELGLNWVSFLCTKPSDVVRYWMNRARVFSVPSVTVDSGASEGFGMVFAEAQAMGLPVASFASGGIPEAVVHGETGLLARERDIAALAQNIVSLLTDRALWQRFSEAGQRRVRKLFDVDRQTAALEDMYRSVLDNAQDATSA